MSPSSSLERWQCFCSCCRWLETLLICKFQYTVKHHYVNIRNKTNHYNVELTYNNVISYWAKCNGCTALLKVLSALLTLGLASCLLKHTVHSPVKGLRAPVEQIWSLPCGKRDSSEGRGSCPRAWQKSISEMDTRL